MKILLIEDEAKIADLVVAGFHSAGMQYECCTDGNIALSKALSDGFDAIVLDLMLPGVNGMDILRAVRERGKLTPVVVLTARTELPDRLAGFNAGADDYLPKPFFVEELVVRVRALVARQRGHNETVMLQSGLQLNRISREANWAGCDVVLSQREFTLTEYLMRSPGHIFSRTQILKHVWGLDFDPKTNVVDVCIQRVRKKLIPTQGPNTKDFPIEAIRGIGYRFREM
jgi:two-component system, OmpR family, response regulator